MAGDYFHGVEHFWLDNNDKPIEILAASTIGLVATADDADAATFPLDTPTLVNSDKLIAKAGEQGTLKWALKDIYAQTGAVVVVVRVAEAEDDAQEMANVIGSVDDETGKYTGMQALLAAETLLGVRPRLILSPDYSQREEVRPAMETLAKKLRAIPIIDGSEGGYSAVINEAQALDEVFFVNGGVKVFDADLAENVGRWMSPTIAGHIVRVDNEEGYWHSPSSRKIYNIQGSREVIDHAIGSTTSKANLYNSNNVSVIVGMQGGQYLYGNRLCNGIMLPHQRIRYIVGDSIMQAHQEMVDRNITKAYVDGVIKRVNKLIRRLKLRGVIRDGEVWVDKELNEASTGTGQAYFDYSLGFYDIAERLTFRQHVMTEFNESIFA